MSASAPETYVVTLRGMHFGTKLKVAYRIPGQLAPDSSQN
jgi:hypothetical protein